METDVIKEAVKLTEISTALDDMKNRLAAELAEKERLLTEAEARREAARREPSATTLYAVAKARSHRDLAKGRLEGASEVLHALSQRLSAQRLSDMQSAVTALDELHDEICFTCSSDRFQD